MPESTSSQCSTSTTYNGINVPCCGSDSQFNPNQSISSNHLQNGTPVQWTELPPHIEAPCPVNSSTVANGEHITGSYSNANTVANGEHITGSYSNANGLNQQIVYNPPNYLNIPYQGSGISNGYNTLNVTRNINEHQSTPNLIRTPNGQIVGGSNWPNQPAIPRYVSQASTWISNKTSGGVKKQKRIRTAFTSQQMMELEQEYARTRYLDRARRIELADTLRLNERTIKIWFQNRRMKEKKDRAESLEDSEEASTSECSSEVANLQTPMLIHQQYPGVSNEIYNPESVYMEPFPTSSTSTPMPETSMSSTLPHIPIPVQNICQASEYISEEQCHAHYQQVHLQVQHYPSYENELQELSPESTVAVKPENVSSTNSAPSDIIEKSWDLSWIRSIQTEEEF